MREELDIKIEKNVQLTVSNYYYEYFNNKNCKQFITLDD